MSVLDGPDQPDLGSPNLAQRARHYQDIILARQLRGSRASFGAVTQPQRPPAAGLSDGPGQPGTTAGGADRVGGGAPPRRAGRRRKAGRRVVKLVVALLVLVVVAAAIVILGGGAGLPLDRLPDLPDLPGFS